jgi:hypothetical protein
MMADGEAENSGEGFNRDWALNCANQEWPRKETKERKSRWGFLKEANKEERSGTAGRQWGRSRIGNADAVSRGQPVLQSERS